MSDCINELITEKHLFDYGFVFYEKNWYARRIEHDENYLLFVDIIDNRVKLLLESCNENDSQHLIFCYENMTVLEFKKLLITIESLFTIK